MARQRSSAASAADRNVPSPAALAPSPSQTVTSPPRLVTRWSSVSAAPVLLRGYAARSRSGSSGQKPAASAPLLQLSSGDQIHHKTFGDGLVISVTPMGGDALLEVAFDTVGTKKLMLKAAGVHITKL